MPCECQFCSLKLDFDLDPHLLEEIEGGRCVIFAGSGVSTETTGAHESSLYDNLKVKVNARGDETFPEMIDLFENQPNGRQKLIEQIKSRFRYIDGWKDLRDAATRFHRSVATAPYFSKFITTNWDRYFENIIEATPFVYDSDLVFWEDAERPVLKIHGSIDNLSTLVASTEDYDNCLNRLKSGRLGDVLRHIFATRTVIFVGYSASDTDFQSIFRAVRESMGRLARTHYLVSPFLTNEQAEALYENFGIRGIKTDATHFVETVKGHMREKYCFAYDEAYEKILDALINVEREHTKFVGSYSVIEEPHLIFATAYQDGLIHCLQRIFDHRYTNNFASLHRVRGQAQLYEERVQHYIRRKDYWNSSYFVGYQLGLVYFDMINREYDPRQNVPSWLLEIPFYFHPKVGYLTREEFEEQVRPNPEVHKSAYRQAVRFTKEFDGSESGIVVQHPPFG